MYTYNNRSPGRQHCLAGVLIADKKPGGPKNSPSSLLYDIWSISPCKVLHDSKSLSGALTRSDIPCPNPSRVEPCSKDKVFRYAISPMVP